MSQDEVARLTCLADLVKVEHQLKESLTLLKAAGRHRIDSDVFVRLVTAEGAIEQARHQVERAKDLLQDEQEEHGEETQP